jgi:hypothetical protein|tara:strand:+ start:3023 stop:3724 length:702 start_codon:yes stop_codon:yes gene_type:complete
MIILRKFTSEGNEKFRLLFQNTDKAEIPDLALKLSKDQKITETLPGAPAIEMPTHRIDVGTLLSPHFIKSPSLAEEIINPFFWNWLSAALMAELVSGSGKVGDSARWFLSTSSPGLMYRHILQSSFWTYRAHEGNVAAAMSVLNQPLDTPGEAVEQLLASKAIWSSVGAELATRLYFDEASKLNKVGHAGASAAGTVRRMTEYLNQIKLTVDFKSMTLDELASFLPAEFDRFR